MVHGFTSKFLENCHQNENTCQLKVILNKRNIQKLLFTKLVSLKESYCFCFNDVNSKENMFVLIKFL